ncbi:hypothetical protein BC834DRAFT_975660 [Gloeopeniophorella convolvens]|nr:hypothetical protein BC834DRAFT_975660 [Gloeopeniophorella convolvens]
MPSSDVWQYLDIEAEHAEDEEEDFDDEELGDFLHDEIVDDEDITTASVDIAASLADEAEDMECLARGFRPQPRIIPSVFLASELPLQVRAPHIGDPGLWCVQVKFGHERDIVSQLARRFFNTTASRAPSIVSAFNRDGIGGYIFVEALSLSDVIRALEGMAAARSSVPRPIDIDRRIELFTSPAPRRLDQADDGCWVRFTSGLYRGDIGYVYEQNKEFDDLVRVLVVPRLPYNARGRAWSDEHSFVSEVVSLFGRRDVKVRDLASDTFFVGETSFRAGVALYWVPRCCLEVSDAMPSDLTPFVRASLTCPVFAFRKWLIKAAQNTIREGMRIVVISGSLKGIVGRVTSILNGTISIRDDFATGGTRSYNMIDLSDLLVHFIPGDNIKARWSLSRGIVIAVSYDPNRMVYIDQKNCEISMPTYEAEAYSPELHTASLRPGVWVNYAGVTGPEDIPMKGYGRIFKNEDGTVYVEDGVARQVVIRCNVDNLEVAAKQREVPLPFAQPVPPKKTDALPPPLMPELRHKEVIVRDGPLKGRIGTIRDHTVYGAAILMHAGLAQHSMHIKWFDWSKLFVWPSRGPHAPRMLQQSPPRGRTASPEPSESRKHTPPPEDQSVLDSLYEKAEDHWIHFHEIQEIMATKRLALAVREHDGTLGISAKTVQLPRRTVQPAEGEVIVSIIRRKLPVQLSMDPRQLATWPASCGDSVIVVEGRWIGWVGKVTEASGELDSRLCVVQFGAAFPDEDKSRPFMPYEIVVLLDA